MRVSTILQPSIFTKKTNVKEYFDMFDLYLKEELCKNDEYRATLLAARMDADCLNIIKCQWTKPHRQNK